MKYQAPDTIDAAVTLLKNSKGARILNGGTDLLVQLRADMITPDFMIDIKRIGALHDIDKTGDGWRIGAAVSGAKLGEHPEFRRDWPGVLEGLELIGSTQVQGRATFAGNLCNGSPAADSVPGLIAANAQVEIAGPQGTRIVPIADIPVGPGKTTLATNEFITAIHLPPRGARSGDAYLRFIPRTEMDIAVAGCAVAMSLDENGIITTARVAIGAVAPTALLVETAGAALIGSTLDDDALNALAKAVSAAANPISDKRGTIEFRTHVIGVLAQRAAKIAYQRAGGTA